MGLDIGDWGLGLGSGIGDWGSGFGIGRMTTFLNSTFYCTYIIDTFTNLRVDLILQIFNGAIVLLFLFYKQCLKHVYSFL